MMQAGGPQNRCRWWSAAPNCRCCASRPRISPATAPNIGLPVTYEEIPGANHFTIMDEMLSPTGRITTLIRQLFERTAG